MANILAYGCTSAAGDGVSAFWKSLCAGERHSRSLENLTWPKKASTGAQGYLWNVPGNVPRRNVQDLLIERLLTAWREAKSKTQVSQSLGVILASTKGCVDDFIWNATPEPGRMSGDPFTPILEGFLRVSELQPARSLCISNACASSLAALFLARSWLKGGAVEQVLVLTADQVGPFVFHGFNSLQALSPTSLRPFSKTRDGLLLGEASAAILLGRGEGPQLLGVGLDTEGHAVTRPEPTGASLLRAYDRVICDSKLPDLIIAHGTGTTANDLTEDTAFSNFPGAAVTASKWCIGHTLASSGAMDVIAACEIMKNRKVFSIAGASDVDPSFKCQYLHDTTHEVPGTVLVSSLGFGGTHAVALIGSRT